MNLKNDEIIEMNLKKDEIIEMKENSNHKQKWKNASYTTNQTSTFYKQSRSISQKNFQALAVVF